MATFPRLSLLAALALFFAGTRDAGTAWGRIINGGNPREDPLTETFATIAPAPGGAWLVTTEQPMLQVKLLTTNSEVIVNGPVAVTTTVRAAGRWQSDAGSDGGDFALAIAGVADSGLLSTVTFTAGGVVEQSISSSCANPHDVFNIAADPLLRGFWLGAYDGCAAELVGLTVDGGPIGVVSSDGPALDAAPARVLGALTPGVTWLAYHDNNGDVDVHCTVDGGLNKSIGTNADLAGFVALDDTTAFVAGNFADISSTGGTTFDGGGSWITRIGCASGSGSAVSVRLTGNEERIDDLSLIGSGPTAVLGVTVTCISDGGACRDAGQSRIGLINPF